MFGQITAFITGTIVKKPTLLKNERGVYCYLSVVVNYRRYNVPGTQDYVEPDPVFADISASGPMAESICKQAEKGMAFAGTCDFRDKTVKVEHEGKIKTLHEISWAVRPREFDIIPVQKKVKGAAAPSAEPTSPAPTTVPEDDFAPDSDGMVGELPF